MPLGPLPVGRPAGLDLHVLIGLDLHVLMLLPSVWVFGRWRPEEPVGRPRGPRALRGATALHPREACSCVMACFRREADHHTGTDAIPARTTAIERLCRGYRSCDVTARREAYPCLRGRMRRRGSETPSSAPCKEEKRSPHPTPLRSRRGSRGQSPMGSPLGDLGGNNRSKKIHKCCRSRSDKYVIIDYIFKGGGR